MLKRRSFVALLGSLPFIGRAKASVQLDDAAFWEALPPLTDATIISTPRGSNLYPNIAQIMKSTIDKHTAALEASVLGND